MKKKENTRLLFRQLFLASLWLILTSLLTFQLFYYIIDRHGLLMGKQYYIIWPSVILSQFGYSHTWIISALLLPLFLAALLFFSIHRRLKLIFWKRLLIIPVFAGLYFITAWLALDLFPNPLPAKTPFDNDSQQREIYLRNWNRGFQIGKMGWWRSFGMGGGTPAEMGGYNDGIKAGEKCVLRTFGNGSKLDFIPKLYFNAWRANN